MQREFIEQWVRNQVRLGEYDISLHAIQRSSEREIDLESAIDCVLHGKIIEMGDYEDNDDICVLFQEPTDDVPEFYTVVAASYKPNIVSICKRKKEVWDFIDGLLVRRGKEKNNG